MDRLLEAGTPEADCIVVRVGARNDFYSWYRNDQSWNNFQLEPLGWNDFLEIKGRYHSKVEVKDPWTEGGRRGTAHQQLRRATAQPKAALHASDARSSTSEAVLVTETIGRRGSPGPKDLGRLSVILLKEAEEIAMWKNWQALAWYNDLQVRLLRASRCV